jgi:peptidoglycan hydrolase CwlO-like protein
LLTKKILDEHLDLAKVEAD